MNAIDGMACCKPGCDNFGKPGLNIRPRLVRDEIGPTAAVPLHSLQGHAQTNRGTAYSGLRCTRREFDQVASLRVEGGEG